jgi:hypothetical protein
VNADRAPQLKRSVRLLGEIMGIILEGAGGDIWASVFEWGQLLRLAQSNGWVPAGTVLDEPNVGWSGGYQTNDWQRVTADDARNLADALSRALHDLPADDKRRSVTVPVELPRAFHNLPTDPVIDCIALEDMERLTPPDWFGGNEGRECVQRYIDFCRAGEFVIK